MRTEPCKAYGNVVPASPALRDAVCAVCADWGLADCVELEGDILRISFEGVFFPQEDVVEAIRPYLTGESSGRLDVFDLEGWRMTRATFAGTEVRLASSGLNDVLAYSGH